MRKLNKIIVHCADTPSTMDIGAKEIRKWHTEERGWSDIGYHYVIRRNGQVERGRPVERMGAHCSGHNKDSIGICLVGRDEFAPEQMEILKQLVSDLRAQHRSEMTVHGHCEFSSKTCPNFDVKDLEL